MLKGRFAPSPTGPLHMGSLLSALASYLDIKQRGGEWLVRIDDLDPPRQDPHAIPTILASLNAHGLIPDQRVDYQSTHQQRYAAAWERLQGELFYCNCPRKQIAKFATYPGHCYAFTNPRPDCAVRIRIREVEAHIEYSDGVAGEQRTNLLTAYGDFIVKRRDELWAYNFATAVDDGSDFTDVLRGQDLARVTAPQLYVMDRLALTRPSYCHIPVLCYPDGTKLSKQTAAPALNDSQPTANLRQALALLGQQPPTEPGWQVAQWLTWGLQHWRRAAIPPQLAPFQANG
ncbi:MAG: tRNA glutamyl-Q(34) synthetase GluQRS [Pseudomonadota bacterium]